LLYFLKGKLPWQGLKAKTKKEKYDMIRDMKANISMETVCKGCPEEFHTYMKMCQKLDFTDTPDYGAMRKVFKDLFVKENLECDYLFDWLSPKKPKKTNNNNNNSPSPPKCIFH